tara:strand:- start:209 stop:349 length:141 start_codon:yes stop_codon:yes gene_type:complete
LLIVKDGVAQLVPPELNLKSINAKKLLNPHVIKKDFILPILMEEYA